MEQFLIDWEGPVLLWIQEHMRNDFLTPVLTFLTHLGDHGYFWIALTILFLLLKKTRKVGGLMTCYACEQRTAEESGGEDETLRGRGWAAQDHRGAE